MTSAPLQLHQFVFRCVLIFLVVGTTLILAFAAGRDSLKEFSRWYISKEIATAPTDELLPIESQRQAIRDRSRSQ